MNHRLPEQIQPPWYRQFWPWFLITLPASVVVAGFITLYIAFRHADDLVVDDYYKNGLAINRQLEKQQFAEQRGISARLTLTDTHVRVNLQGPVQSDNLRLRLSHPMEADQDFEVLLSRADAGIYEGRGKSGVMPHWHWILDDGEGSEWRLDGAVSAGDLGDAAAY